ncbi:hypothetical protein K2X33_07755 [bacterium]|nr:hypothetical protein [bacterium]
MLVRLAFFALVSVLCANALAYGPHPAVKCRIALALQGIQFPDEREAIAQYGDPELFALLVEIEESKRAAYRLEEVFSQTAPDWYSSKQGAPLARWVADKKVDLKWGLKHQTPELLVTPEGSITLVHPAEWSDDLEALDYELLVINTNAELMLPGSIPVHPLYWGYVVSNYVPEQGLSAYYGIYEIALSQGKSPSKLVALYLSQYLRLAQKAARNIQILREGKRTESLLAIRFQEETAVRYLAQGMLFYIAMAPLMQDLRTAEDILATPESLFGREGLQGYEDLRPLFHEARSGFEEK